MYASQKFKVYSSLRRPEPHFRHAQGHERACALTGCLKIFQCTIITVHEVVHQKAVNTKLGEQTIWLSEVIKEFYHYFQEKKAGRQKSIERKMHCIPKTH